MHKIILIGCPGSGKTTFAKTLGEKLTVPVTHLDQIMWLPGNVAIPYQQFLQAQEEVFKKDSWIIDGNYTKSIPNRIDKAETIIFFDTSRIVCLWRIIKRYFMNFGKPAPDLGGNNSYVLDFKLIKFVLTYPSRDIYKMLENIKPNKTLYIIKHDSDLDLVLNSIR